MVDLYHMGALWLTSLNLSDIMHIVERLTTAPSDVIAPVGVICDVTAELWVLNFWIKFATVQAQNALI
jgi:hypothetical protein